MLPQNDKRDAFDKVRATLIKRRLSVECFRQITSTTTTTITTTKQASSHHLQLFKEVCAFVEEEKNRDSLRTSYKLAKKTNQIYLGETIFHCFYCTGIAGCQAGHKKTN